jgi:hypothetical protein
MWGLAWAEIGHRVRIEAEIVAAGGVRVGVVDADVGAGDGLAVVEAAGGTVAAVVGVGTKTPIWPPISAADFSDFADKKLERAAINRCGLFSFTSRRG